MGEMLVSGGVTTHWLSVSHEWMVVYHPQVPPTIAGVLLL